MANKKGKVPTKVREFDFSQCRITTKKRWERGAVVRFDKHPCQTENLFEAKFGNLIRNNFLFGEFEVRRSSGKLRINQIVLESMIEFTKVAGVSKSKMY